MISGESITIVQLALTCHTTYLNFRNLESNCLEAGAMIFFALLAFHCDAALADYVLCFDVPR